MYQNSELTLNDCIRDKNAHLLVQAALARGFKVAPLALNFFIVESNGKSEHFHVSMAGSISHIAKTITWDKALTKYVLDRNGIPTPRGIEFSRRDLREAEKHLIN